MSLYGQTPGDVQPTRLEWWLKSNAETYRTGTTPATNGQTVATWADQSGTNDATNGTAGTSPILRTAIINGYSALEFDGTKFLDGSAASIGPTQNFYMFMVFKQNSFQVGLNNDDAGSFIIDRPSGTMNLASFKIVSGNKYCYQRRDDAGANIDTSPISSTDVNTTSFVIAEYYRIRVSAASATEGIYLNGASDILQAGPTSAITGPPMRIGRHAVNVNNGLNGYFTEIALYTTSGAPNFTMTAAERLRINSYLAIKYGITLSSTVNYVRADGTTIYPSTGSHSGYVSDIAGIGRDDESSLSQTTSHSQNTDYVLTVSNPSNLNDEEFFVWGSNNGSLTTPNSVDVGGAIMRRLSRVWRIAETGDVGTITLAFDLSGVPGSKVQADLRLLVDRDGDGFADNDRTPIAGTLAGSTFTVTTATGNLINGDYITIGTTNTTTTPLPIELTDFKVTYEKPQVIASWQTATELNNDYFTLERAGEDLSFTDIARIPGAGTSKVPRSYSAIDVNPIGGKSYYRIKQTDYDGTFTYSAPRYIFIEGSGELTVYPNPSDGRSLNLRLGNVPFQLTQVEVFDQKGRSIEHKVISQAAVNQYSIELNNRLPAGLYIIRVSYNGKQEFIKLAVN